MNTKPTRKITISLLTLLLIAIVILPLFTSTFQCATASADERTSNTATNNNAPAAEANFTNLIVFARFSDEDEFVDDVYSDVAVRRLIENTYTASRYSVTNYFRSASDEKIRMQNLYLFDNGGSLTLSQPRGYYAEKDDENAVGYDEGEQYARMYELKEDWSQAINRAISSGAKPTFSDGGTTYPLDELDKNNDGKIDAITLIYKNTTQNINVTWSSPLWNYQDYAEYVSVTTESGKTVTSSAYVQLTFTYGNADRTFVYTDEDGCRFLSQSTAAHETGHIFGLKDLYRSASVSKIYYMSLMGKHLSPVGQFLSVKEREAMGWLDENRVKTLAKEGTYTVAVSGSSSGGNIVGYKFDIQGSGKTLYLEYRKFDGTQNIFDSQSKNIYMSDGSALKGVNIKSGLVCYLASTDMKVPSNLGTTGNNWNYEAVGGTTATKNDCALGEGEYIDIPGSSLFVKVQSVSDDELVFSIEGDELKNNGHTHTAEYVEATDATCTQSGQKSHYRCTGCGEYFADEKCETEMTAENLFVAPKGHTEETLPEKEPTCTESGLTEGKKCAVCNEILQEQDVLPALGHIDSEWITDKTPTVEEEGLRHKECLRCHIKTDEEILPKLPHGDNDNKGDNTGSGDNGNTPDNDKKDDTNGSDNSGLPDNKNDGQTKDDIPPAPPKDDSGTKKDDTADNTALLITLAVAAGIFAAILPIIIVVKAKLKKI